MLVAKRTPFLLCESISLSQIHSFSSKLVQHSSAFVMEGVKNLVVKKHNLPVTKIVDELMEVNPLIL